MRPEARGSQVYFDRSGIENTDVTIRLALNYAADHGIKDIVVASTTGYTAEKIVKAPGREALNTVIVTHNTGFREEGVQSFPADLRQAWGPPFAITQAGILSRSLWRTHCVCFPRA